MKDAQSLLNCMNDVSLLDRSHFIPTGFFRGFFFIAVHWGRTQSLWRYIRRHLRVFHCGQVYLSLIHLHDTLLRDAEFACCWYRWDSKIYVRLSFPFCLFQTYTHSPTKTHVYTILRPCRMSYPRPIFHTLLVHVARHTWSLFFHVAALCHMHSFIYTRSERMWRKQKVRLEKWVVGEGVRGRSDVGISWDREGWSGVKIN